MLNTLSIKIMNKQFTLSFLNFIIIVAVMGYIGGCSSNDISDPVDCTVSDLALSAVAQQNPSGCAILDGAINVEGAGGKAPYQFALNTGAYGSASAFTGLGGGTHLIRIKDSNGCERSIEITITAPGSTLAAASTTTSDSECFTNNGVITVNATGGSTPYQYKLGSAAFGSTAIFTGLAAGNYTIIVKDNEGCTVNVNSSISSGNTGVSFSKDINPILQSNCLSSGCHGSGSNNGDWTKFDNVKSKASVIRSRTTDKSMPQGGTLTAQQISLIACWVNDGALNN
jgi:SprB repeat